jgi:shikimate kinase
LLQTDEPLARLEQLFAERDPLYRSIADIIVDTGSQSLGSLIQKLERQLLDHQAAAVDTAGAPTRTD